MVNEARRCVDRIRIVRAAVACRIEEFLKIVVAADAERRRRIPLVGRGQPALADAPVGIHFKGPAPDVVGRWTCRIGEKNLAYRCAAVVQAVQLAITTRAIGVDRVLDDDLDCLVRVVITFPLVPGAFKPYGAIGLDALGWQS